MGSELELGRIFWRETDPNLTLTCATDLRPQIQRLTTLEVRPSGRGLRHSLSNLYVSCDMPSLSKVEGRTRAENSENFRALLGLVKVAKSSCASGAFHIGIVSLENQCR